MNTHNSTKALSNYFTRRDFLKISSGIGLSAAGMTLLQACGISPTAPPTEPIIARGLTPFYCSWMLDLYPRITEVNAQFEGLNVESAPGPDMDHVTAEARDKQSSWDVYLGVSPFIEIATLIEADIIEPWDNYIPKEIIDDIIPSIREECTVDGKLYSWPFLLGIIVQGYNVNITNLADIADEPPPNWDVYLANAKQVIDEGAAEYGCTFDARGWRSLAPITHSISTDAYYKLDGDKSGALLFDFTSDAAIQALQILKRMLDLSSANALQPRATDGRTPDEVAFAEQSVAYYSNYQYAPLSAARNWPDPTALRLGALPKGNGSDGSTVVWSSGASLFKWGQNKEEAVEYMKALTYDDPIWKDSISGNSSSHPGHLPPYKSIYTKWEQTPPDWLAVESWVPLMRNQLDLGKAISNHSFGQKQFIIGQPLWEKYLNGEEQDPLEAMQAAKDAVAAEVLKAS